MLTYHRPPDTPVTPEFRELVLALFPNLNTPLLLRLLDHLLFSVYFDRETGDLLMGWELLNSLRGPNANKDFSVPRLVAGFSEAAFAIEVSTSSWRGGQMARLIRSDAPATLLEAKDRMLLEGGNSPLVGLVSGNPVDPNALRTSLRDEAERLLDDAKHPRIADLIRYLNGLPAELFDSVYERIPDATEVTLGIANPIAQQQQKAMLQRLKSCPQPFYRPVPTSARVYAHGASYLNMASPIRARLTGQWAKLDLKQAQLMIVSRLWGQDGIRAYVERLDVSLWQDICRYAGVEYTPENKAVFKTCVYSLTYGMGRAKARLNVADHLGRTVALRCLEHPVLSLLMRARKAKMDDLLLAGGCADAFGNRLEVEGWSSDKTNRKRALSILACQAQSFEMPLLMPIIDYARDTEGEGSPLYVTGWLHDGVWLHCNDAGALDAHIVNAVGLIRETSRRTLGFEMGVDVEMPGR